MPRHRSWLLLLVPPLLLAACERSQVVPPADSTLPVAGANTPLAPSGAAAPWDADLGPMLLVGTDVPERGGIVTPDSATDTASTLVGRRVRVLGRDGSTQLATIAAIDTDADNGCTGLAVWRLDAARGSLPAWTVGFADGEKIEPIAMQPVEEMRSADSSAVVAQVTRLASMITGASSQRLSGLPFTVRSAWRFSPAPGVQVIATTLIRALNVEANPVVERTFVVAERDSGQTRYRLAYHERSQGTEESVESVEVVSAIRLGPNAAPTLVIARDFDTSTSYSLLERHPDGTWRQRWTSRRLRC